MMLVGEAPGESEVRQRRPFVGASGQELDRMLHDAGINRTDCYITNVVRQRPPSNKIEKFFLKHTANNRIPGPIVLAGIDHLKKEILALRPKVIVAFGDTALWALTGNTGIVKWRGSQLTYCDGDFECTLIPTYHPAAVLRQWSWRFVGVLDLRRAVRALEGPPKIPSYEFLVRPSFVSAMERLSELAGISIPCLISCDIETRAGHIACIGFGTSPLHAFCIPFMCIERHSGYFSSEEELSLVLALQRVFRNPHIKWAFQNGLYDVQYISRYWGVVPRVYMDTMLAHHVCYAGLPKGLDFLSSIYCDYHVYWKDDGKLWDPNKVDEDQLWEYNCEDCVNTFEIAVALESQLDQLQLRDQFNFQMQQFPAVFRMMQVGVRCRESLKGDLIMELEEAKLIREQWLNTAIGRDFNVRSPKQMKEFFFDEMKIKPVLNRKTGSITTNDAALETIKKRAPYLTPVVTRIQELRSIGVFLSTFAMMKLDRDHRIRCSYNIAGTETFRYSSSENAFGSGTNLQNVPSGDALLPNIKRMFVPDPGYEMFDADLDRADAQVVAWEANDDILKQMFREGADIHLENAKTIFNNERLTEDSKERKLAKAGVHATNYGASPRTLAIALGITTREAEDFIRKWFAAHPGIADWHRRVEDSVFTTRTVSNKFGFRRYYFDRIEGILPEALAWIPQSTVALVICRGLVGITENLPEVQCLLQVHDSLVGQYPSHLRGPMLRAIEREMLIPIPYDDPLTIPVGFQISQSSWGECVDYSIYPA
jgi:DNA polymerase-1